MKQKRLPSGLAAMAAWKRTASAGSRFSALSSERMRSWIASSRSVISRLIGGVGGEAGTDGEGGGEAALAFQEDLDGFVEVQSEELPDGVLHLIESAFVLVWRGSGI